MYVVPNARGYPRPGIDEQEIRQPLIALDLITGERKSTGSNVHVVVPGEGTVQLAAGMFRIDENGDLVREVGRQDPPVTPALCEALS